MNAQNVIKNASDYIFFWMTGEYNEEFSNWYPCSFIVDGKTYCHTEQYFMAKKALTFGDQETYEQICNTTDPGQCKKLGRNIKPFDSAKWDAVSYRIMVEGNLAKFSQNDKLKKRLLATGEKELAEASPYDLIWGIGLSAQEAFFTPTNQWMGRNLMGKCLMEVRECLRKEEERSANRTQLSEQEIKDLIRAANEQLKFSYAPYSHFCVGAALLTENGRIHTGCNIENASYSMTNCAERTAIFKAVSEGEKSFKAICILGGEKGVVSKYASPCGACRQVMAEFCNPEQFQVILAVDETDYKVYRLDELLPHTFQLS